MTERPPSFQPAPQGPIDESLLDDLSTVDFEALRWAVRVDDGLRAADRAEFQAWLDADARHPPAFRNFASVSQALGALPPVATARLGAGPVSRADTRALQNLHDLCPQTPGLGGLPERSTW